MMMNPLGNDNKHMHLAALAGSVCLALGLVLAFALSAMGGAIQAAPSVATAPGLGAAAGFAVLAGTAVTCTDSTITGDVGVYPGTAVTQTSCTITGTVHAGDPAAAAAHTDFLSAYDALAPVPCDAVLTGTLAGVTLGPGVYCFDAAATLTGQLTLDGPANGIWIFKVGTSGTGALTGTSFSVVMAGSGQPCNVYWWVAEAATLTDSNFVGTILAGAASTITRGTFAGDVFAKAAVTMTGTHLVACGCALSVQAHVCLRVAGNSWNTVRMDLFADDVLVGSVTVTRTPGSPNGQAKCVVLDVDLLGTHTYRADVTFEPKPGAKKGADSVWVLVVPMGAKINPGHAVLKFHHVFHVGDPATYLWKVPLPGLGAKLIDGCGCDDKKNHDRDGRDDDHDHDGRDDDDHEGRDHHGHDDDGCGGGDDHHGHDGRDDDDHEGRDHHGHDDEGGNGNGGQHRNQGGNGP